MLGRTILPCATSSIPSLANMGDTYTHWKTVVSPLRSKDVSRYYYLRHGRRARWLFLWDAVGKESWLRKQRGIPNNSSSVTRMSRLFACSLELKSLGRDRHDVLGNQRCDTLPRRDRFTCTSRERERSSTTVKGSQQINREHVFYDVAPEDPSLSQAAPALVFNSGTCLCWCLKRKSELTPVLSFHTGASVGIWKIQIWVRA